MDKNKTNYKKSKIVIIAVFVFIFIIVCCIPNIIKKEFIRNEITNYLSSEFNLKDIKIKFVEPYSDVWDYGVEVYSSNLNTLSYEIMTRIEYYLTSHTDLDACDVNVEKYICGNDSYRIFTTSVYKNGQNVYEYKKGPSSSITSADAPYVGMKDDYIGCTKLGRPSDTEYCKDYGSLRADHRSITYKWYNPNGKMIYYAFSKNGEIISVSDYR